MKKGVLFAAAVFVAMVMFGSAWATQRVVVGEMITNTS